MGWCAKDKSMIEKLKFYWKTKRVLAYLSPPFIFLISVRKNTNPKRVAEGATSNIDKMLVRQLSCWKLAGKLPNRKTF
jgi:hypothetical protein